MLRKLCGVIFIMISFSSQSKPSSNKVLIAGEHIIPGNPWRTEFVQRQYKIAYEWAMQEHLKKHPKSEVEVRFSFDEGPHQSFDKAKKEGAFGVIGYLYSSDAIEAANVAQKKQIPFLSPVSPLKGLRNDFSHSLAANHDDLEKALESLKKDFNHPSVVLAPRTALTNFEFNRIFEEVFDVLASLRGQAIKMWEKLEIFLEEHTQNGKVNILLGGYAFEQMDLVVFLNKTPFRDKVNFIANPQWNYNPTSLGLNLTQDMDNFYLFSDYFEPEDLASDSPYRLLSEKVAKEPMIDGRSINEPIVYALTDMFSIALEQAEHAESRADYGKRMASYQHQGVLGNYDIKDHYSTRKVYLGKWTGKKIEQQKLL